MSITFKERTIYPLLFDEKTEGKWEELPADFICPECGVGKEDYEAELWHSV